jgi:hypothetical protein
MPYVLMADRYAASRLATSGHACASSMPAAPPKAKIMSPPAARSAFSWSLYQRSVSGMTPPTYARHPFDWKNPNV